VGYVKVKGSQELVALNHVLDRVLITVNGARRAEHAHYSMKKKKKISQKKKKI
jgi:hypothetical protein